MDGRHNNHGTIGQHHRVDWQVGDRIYPYGLGCEKHDNCFTCKLPECTYNGKKWKEELCVS